MVEFTYTTTNEDHVHRHISLYKSLSLWFQVGSLGVNGARAQSLATKAYRKGGAGVASPQHTTRIIHVLLSTSNEGLATHFHAQVRLIDMYNQMSAHYIKTSGNKLCSVPGYNAVFEKSSY